MFDLTSISKSVDSKGYFICHWDEVSESTLIDVSTSYGLEEFKEGLEANGLDAYPRIVRSSNGFSVANRNATLLGETLVFHRPHAALNKQQTEVVRGLVAANIAVVMAKADGVIDEAEIASLKAIITSQAYLSEAEQYAIFVHGLHLMQQRIMRDAVLAKFDNLEPQLQKIFLTVAKDVAVSDGFLAKQERLVLADLYRLADIPTKTVGFDLRKHAKANGVTIEKRQTEALAQTNADEPNIAELVDDASALEALLDEFGSF